VVFIQNIRFLPTIIFNFFGITSTVTGVLIVAWPSAIMGMHSLEHLIFIFLIGKTLLSEKLFLKILKGLQLSVFLEITASKIPSRGL